LLPRKELDRRTAAILSASSLVGLWFSASEDEAFSPKPMLAGGDLLLFDVASGVMDRRLKVFVSCSRSGDVSESDDDEKIVVVGGGGIGTEVGELSDFLDKKPALNRLFLLCAL
jgi:hypothetical protein